MAGALFALSEAHAAEKPEIEALRASAIDKLRLGDRGHIRWARWPRGAFSGGDAESQSKTLLREHGRAFGLSKLDDAHFLESKRDSLGHKRVTYRRYYRGLPVFGSEVRFHFDNTDSLQTVHGTLAGPAIASPFKIFDSDAEAAALVWAYAQEGETALDPIPPQPLYHDPKAIRGGAGVFRPAWKVGVWAGLMPYWVFIDGEKGGVLDVVPRGAHLEREIWSTDGRSKNLLWTEGDAAVVSSPAVNTLLVATEQTYNMFKNLSLGTVDCLQNSCTPYDSFDGAGATLSATILADGYYGFCPGNAAWTGTETLFCEDAVTTDIVAHEWTHAYTQYTHNLLYVWQSGALNEGYSDIFGELVDLWSATEASAKNQPRMMSECTASLTGRASDSTSERWLVAEDAPLGPYRDMWSPRCHRAPADQFDAERYFCRNDDNGGVHVNSSIPGRAFALLVDGGTLNGVDVSGIGAVKAAHIYYRAMTQYQTMTTEFPDHADALEQACDDFAETGLELLHPMSGAASGLSIERSDCWAVHDVVAAMGLREDNPCGDQPLLKQEPPSLCSSGPEEMVAYEDFESGSVGWNIGHVAVSSSFVPRDFVLVGDLPEGRPGHAMFGPGYEFGSCAEDEHQTGVLYLESPEYRVPERGNLNLSFLHAVSLEYTYDGGVVEASVNGGAYRRVPEQLFRYNPYNQSLEGGTSLGAVKAFTGSDRFSVGASWGESQVKLSDWVRSGDRVRFRFALGTDYCVGLLGWYIDDVSVYACPPCPAGECCEDSCESDDLARGFSCAQGRGGLAWAWLALVLVIGWRRQRRQHD